MAYDAEEFDKALEESSFQTSEEETEETVEDTTSTEESEETDGGDDTTIETPKEENDYKKKFSESSREALRLLEEKKRIEAERDEERASREQLKKDLEETQRLLQESNPEAYNFKSLEKSVVDVQKKLALQEEEKSLNEYFKQNPEAEVSKEALKQLGRSNPKLSYGQLWETFFEPLAKKGVESRVANLQKKKASMPETGKGSSASDLTVDVGTAAFNKLPIEKRKEILKRKGL